MVDPLGLGPSAVKSVGVRLSSSLPMPGNYECRTGIPLVGSVELRASHCTHCGNFEPCYTSLGNKFKKFLDNPSQCQFTEMGPSKYLKILPSRLIKRNELHTTGELLNNCLGNVGLIRSAPHALRKSMKQVDPKGFLPEFIDTNVYCTNAVRHRSCSEDGSKNIDPTKAQIEACNPWLEMTIRIVKPKTIVALGTPALKALKPAMNMTEFRITKFCPESLNVIPESMITALHDKVYVCVHPSFIMRQDNEYPKHGWRDKLEQILSLAKEEAEK
jgi:uracil-DNA glycosylase family 4